MIPGFKYLFYDFGSLKNSNDFPKQPVHGGKGDPHSGLLSPLTSVCVIPCVYACV